MKIFLSIDWDYFIEATASERMTLFPDGGNERVGSGLSEIIWSNRYSGSMLAFEKSFGRKIEDMGVFNSDFALVKRYLKKHSKLLNGLGIAESHSMAYNMFSSALADGEKCAVINIDFHHDLYSNTPGNVDCGNWLAELHREGKVEQIYWVAREDSDALPDDYIGTKSVVRTTDLYSLLRQFPTVDGIFLCRSGVWSPPHLDRKLIELVASFTGSTKQVGANLKNRYTCQFKSMVAQAYEQDKQMMEFINKNRKE